MSTPVCLTELLLMLSSMIFCLLLIIVRAGGVPRNATMRDKSDELVVERFSSVLRKSFFKTGCNTQSYNCRSCTQYKRCRFCVMKPLGGDRLLVETGVSGKSQLVGKCVDATHEGWNNPVPITDRLEEYHKETGLVFTELRYGECGIVAPDFVRGFTCWDVESASEWARYRDELEQMLSKGVDARAITEETRELVQQERIQQLQQMRKKQDEELLHATLQEQLIETRFKPGVEDNQRTFSAPVDGVLMTILAPIFLILLASVLAALFSRLCGFRTACCCFCICTIKFIRCLKRKFKLGCGRDCNVGIRNLTTSSEVNKPCPFHGDGKPLEFPGFFRTCDLSTTSGSWGGSTLSRNPNPVISSRIQGAQQLDQNQQQEYSRTISSKQQLEQWDEVKTLLAAMCRSEVDRDFFNSPIAITSDNSHDHKVCRDDMNRSNVSKTPSTTPVVMELKDIDSPIASIRTPISK